MSKKLLIATPHKSFGELLSSSLDMDELNTIISLTSRDALSHNDIDLAIIDADINESDLDAFQRALLENSPRLGIIIIHSLDQQISLDQGQDERVILLIRPFDHAELLESIGKLTSPRANPEPMAQNLAQSAQIPDDNWLSDMEAIKSRLDNLLSPPLIRQALLLSSKNTIGSTMQTSQNTLQHLVETITPYTDPYTGGSLIKFINFENVDHILLARYYPDIGTLAALFDPAVKFSLAKNLLNKMAARLQENYAGTGYETLTYGEEASNTTAGQLLDKSLTSSMTSPGWIPEAALTPASPGETNNFEITYPWDTNLEKNSDKQPGLVNRAENITAGQIEFPSAIDGKIQGLESSGMDVQGDYSNAPLHPGDESISPEDDTRPIAIYNVSESENIVFPKIKTDAWELVSYSFLMISNYPHYRLKDETARLVEDEIRSTCHDNGWFLLYLETHQDYIQLSVRVPETLPPALIIKLFRQRTTNVLLDGFTESEKELMEGDFWASGQLITIGSKPEIL